MENETYYYLEDYLAIQEQHLYSFIANDKKYIQWMHCEFNVEISSIKNLFSPYTLVQYIINNYYNYNNLKFSALCDIGTSTLQYLEENEMYDNFDLDTFINIVGVYLQKYKSTN